MRIFQRLTFLLIAPLLVLSLLTSGCDPNKLKQARIAGQTIERTTDAVVSLIPTFEQSGELSPEDAQAGLKLLTDFKSTIHQFNVRAASYTTFDAKSKADLLKLFQDVTAGLAVLNEQGVTRIKNPKLKGRIQISLAIAQVAAAAIAGVLEGQDGG
jgi:hypothetical protein